MIVTVTPNPSVDRTVLVDALVRGEVTRARSARVDPGGKGVNISRALAAHGTKHHAPSCPPAAPEGRLLCDLLAGAQGVEVVAGADHMVDPGQHQHPRAGRHHDQDQRAGPAAGPGRVRSACSPRRSLNCAASARRGWSAAAACRRAWTPTSSPASCRAGTDPASGSRSTRRRHPARRAAQAAPHLLKPNREELAEATGRTLDTIGDVVPPPSHCGTPGGQVIASLGEHGALLVDGTAQCHARPPHHRARRSRPSAPATRCSPASCTPARTTPAALADRSRVGHGRRRRLPGSQMPGPADVAGIDVSSASRRPHTPRNRLLLTTQADTRWPTSSSTTTSCWTSTARPHAATAELAGRLAADGRVTDLDGFLADVRKREEQMPTGLPGGIGIPHARSAHVTAPTLGLRPQRERGRLRRRGRPGAPDLPDRSTRGRRRRPPEDPRCPGATPHACRVPSVPARCRKARRCRRHRQQRSGERMKLVAVTSCPTGIAHTYMAAEALRSPPRPQVTRSRSRPRARRVPRR